MACGSVTIGILRRNRQLLEVGCTRCTNVSYVDARILPFHGLIAAQVAYKRMKCSKCGDKTGYSRPDARVSNATGQCSRT